MGHRTYFMLRNKGGPFSSNLGKCKACKCKCDNFFGNPSLIDIKPNVYIYFFFKGIVQTVMVVTVSMIQHLGPLLVLVQHLSIGTFLLTHLQILKVMLTPHQIVVT